MGDELRLGAFSVSLAVADLDRSLAFYEALGFVATGGDAGAGWLLLRNDDGTMIGLFQDLFDGNVLTFNPGLRQDMTPDDRAADIRDLEDHLVALGIEPVERVTSDDGPGHLVILDPDGNAIMLDQLF